MNLKKWMILCNELKKDNGNIEIFPSWRNGDATSCSKRIYNTIIQYTIYIYNNIYTINTNVYLRNTICKVYIINKCTNGSSTMTRY